VRGAWLLALAILAGCGAADLYEPPTSDYAISGRLALPSRAEDVSILGDVAYIACGQAGMAIVDISDPAAPTLLKLLDTVKYAESIKVASTPAPAGVTDIAFVVEGTEGITTYDVTAPAAAYSFQQGTTAVDGNGLFVELQANPDDPYIVYLAENWKGLRIFESDPATPGLLRYNGVFSSTRGFAKAVTVRDGYAYVADDEMGLTVLDVRTLILGSVVVVSSCDTGGNALGVDMIDATHVVVADGLRGLVIMEIRSEGSPAVPVPYQVGQLALPGRAETVVVRDGTAYVAAQDGGVHFVDVTNPAAPAFLGTVITGFATGIALAESGAVVVSDRDLGLVVLTAFDTPPPPDTTPPSPVRDLTAQVASATSVRLEWRAPGDDGLTGTAAQYDIRYALAPIDTLPAWEGAIQVEGEPVPAERGSTETFVVGGLTRDTEYFFALRTADATGNWSDLSNCPMVRTPLGDVFIMGSPPDEPGRDVDETPHAVVLTRDVEFADHEVTQAEYEAVMGTNPSRVVGANLPVHNVTWFDAILYLNARSVDAELTPAYTVDGENVIWNQEANGYRLPTEAEWEAACRAGTETAFAGGPLTEEACGFDPVLDPRGWYCGNAGAAPHAVQTKEPNARGLYDMHGNVWEWCWDRYTADLGTAVVVDPTGPTAGGQRTIRGGSWYYFARDCRSAARAPYWPNSADDIVGIRAARTLP
jgi:formylglycine-generating enzyme required for sulfatase activity